MKQLAYRPGRTLDDTDAFFIQEQDTPVPLGHDVRVHIEAIGVNPVDTKLRARATDPAASPVVLGWDAAGTVEAVGEAVTLFKPGDAVFYAGDVTRAGCYASHQLVDERIVGPKPASLSFLQAAALPLTSLTAWEALFARMKIQATTDQGKSLLIIGAAGGVGSMAIQLAKRCAGLTVLATASRQETRQWCQSLGADRVLDHHADLQQQCQDQGLAGPDYILCLNDTDHYFQLMADIIAPQGLICAVVDTRQKHDISVLKAKSAGLVWEFMFTRSRFQTPDMIRQHEILAQVATLVDQGQLVTTLKAELGPINAENIRRAHQLLESGTSIGKMVLSGMVE